MSTQRTFPVQWLARKKGDVYLKPGEGRETDIVIPVMGPTGVGKSTFINNVLDSMRFPQTLRAATSSGFSSCTSALQHFIVTVPLDHPVANALSGRRLVLVDTPGFDDTNLSDSEILRRISVWLASSYGERIKVGGVVYMFPIYPNRITRNDRANTRVFQKICGKGNLTRIALATTRWSICPDKVGEGREAELRNNFWHEMLPQDKRASALLVRLDDSSNSASELLHAILGRLIESEHKKITDVALDIQEQIVKKERTIPETEAAKELRQKLLDLMAEATVGESPQQRKERLHNLMIQAKELKIPMLRRIANFFSSK